MKAGELLQNFLARRRAELAELEAQLILARALRRPRAWLLAHLDAPLTAAQTDSAEQAFAQLQAGTPLPYILGHWEFYGLDFDLSPDTLIPRPETELLVEKAIAFLNNHPSKRNIIDVGTGSGVIAICIAKHIPDAKIAATDISSKALEIAKRNAIKHGVNSQIEFVECDLIPDRQPQPADRREHSPARRPLPIDLICANLPYIPTETLRGLDIYGKEPTLALDGGKDGLDLYRKLFALWKKRHAENNRLDWESNSSKDRSKNPARLGVGLRQSRDSILNDRNNSLVWLCEVEETHGPTAVNVAKQFFPNAKVTLLQDLAGKDRLMEIIA